MPFFDYHQGFIRFKIAYFGPAFGGKTTNLRHLRAAAGGQTEMASVENEGDRALFFDYSSGDLGRIGGIETVFELWAAPGTVSSERSLKMLLKDVDGVVFVADSQLAAMDDNIESWRILERILEEEGGDIADLPLVVQYNKRDLDEVASIGWLQSALNPGERLWFEAVAAHGRNVRETLDAVCREVFDLASTRYQLTGEGPVRHSRAPRFSEPDTVLDLDGDEHGIAPLPVTAGARRTFRGPAPGVPSLPPVSMPSRPAEHRLKREDVEDIIAPLFEATERLADAIERNRLSIDALVERLDRLEPHIGTKAAATLSSAPPTSHDVDDFLKDYLREVDGSSQS